MNEICKNVREELAREGCAPDDPTIREHLASCEDCARFLERLSELESALGALPKKDVSDQVVANLLARPELSRWNQRSWRKWTMVLAAAASLAFLALFLPAYRDRALYQREFEVGPSAGTTSAPSRQESVDELRSQKFERDVIGENEPLELLTDDYGARPMSPDDERFAQSKEEREVLLDAERKDVDVPGKKKQDEGTIVALTPSNEELQRALQDGKGVLSSEQDATVGGRASGVGGVFGGLVDEVRPEKRLDRKPVYPDAARRARVQGTVVLELAVDRDGSVVDAKVVQSVPLLDQAALDAVRQWKYVATEEEGIRRFHVSVSFELEEPDQSSALSLLEERRTVENVPFREATGYWANTYIPGDPWLRQLEARLRSFPLESSGAPAMALHRIAKPAPLLLDPSSSAALAVFVHADRVGVTEKSRLLVQVGIQAREQHGRRRPPMNLAVVLHTSRMLSAADASGLRAFLESLEGSREPGDRFRLVVTGADGGEVLTPETFRHGPLTVALQGLFSKNGASNVASLDPTNAMALALERVLAGDDPNAPLGTSLVVLATTEPLGAQIEPLRRMASHAAVGGVTVSAVTVGARAPMVEAQRVSLAGHGRVYGISSVSDAPRVVDGELSAAGRAVARAVRLRIQLAEGVRLVDVLGSERLDAREAERVRAEEKSIDVRLARNLGIEADRGDDEDGIQIILPSFYAGDAHSILLDVIAEGPGPIAEVTARYKDLVQLENTVARASLALPRSEAAPGTLQTAVFKDYLGYRVSESLKSAAECLTRGRSEEARQALAEARGLLVGLEHGMPELSSDRDVARDVALLDGYLSSLSRIDPNYLRDSLFYASALKRLWVATS